jgi:hypothetical protein
VRKAHAEEPKGERPMNAVALLLFALSSPPDLASYCWTDEGEQSELCDDTDGTCLLGGACYAFPPVCWEDAISDEERWCVGTLLASSCDPSPRNRDDETQCIGAMNCEADD